jgi:sulfite reductase alpha subunit-like flavoprotein
MFRRFTHECVLTCVLTTTRRSFSSASASRSRSVQVLFGSQTGTAQAIAHGFREAAAERGFHVTAFKALDDALPLDPSQPTVIVVSNFGVGEPPDNAKRFFAEISSTTNAPALAALRFAVFGLGNSSYGGMYQRTGKMLDERLTQLGGKRLIARGEGDSANMHDPEDDFESWRAALLDALDGALPTTEDTSTSAAGAVDSKSAVANETAASDVFQVVPVVELARRATVVNDRSAVLFDLPQPRSLHTAPRDTVLASPTHPLCARVVDHRELHHLASPRSCVHVAFDVDTSAFAYETGDYIGVVPENSTEDVEFALSGLRHASGISRKFSAPALAAGALVAAAPEAAAFSAQHARFPVTLDTVLRHYVDLTRPAPRRLLRLLSAHADTEQERKSLESLAELTRQEGDVHAISSAFVLARVTHSLIGRVSISQLLMHMNPLAARFYSISSAASLHPGEAWVACSRQSHWDVSKSTTFVGCSSRSLARLRPGDTANVFPVASNFRLSRLARDDQPIVMIANGSGLAPFRAFCEERRARRATGATVLLYGCIDRDHFIYSDEFDSWSSEGVVEVHAVFSHADLTRPPAFVQHKLVAGDPVGERVWDLLQRHDAVVFICGTPQMSDGVAAAFNTMAGGSGDYVAQLRATGRYHREVFK